MLDLIVLTWGALLGLGACVLLLRLASRAPPGRGRARPAYPAEGRGGTPAGPSVSRGILRASPARRPETLRGAHSRCEELFPALAGLQLVAAGDRRTVAEGRERRAA